jgi:hypothetical protein
MNIQRNLKWKTSDYTRVTLLFLGQALLILALFIGAFALYGENVNIITMFLHDKTWK